MTKATTRRARPTRSEGSGDGRARPRVKAENPPPKGERAGKRRKRGE